MTDVIVKDIKNGSEYYYGGSAEVSAEDVSYDNSSSGATADNIQDAMDEVFQSVSNGKELIADAITDKGVSTSATDSFQTMASNIGLIGNAIIQGDYALLRGPCGIGFHVPTSTEWQAIINTGITANQFATDLHIPSNGSRSGDGGNWSGRGGVIKLWCSDVLTDTARYVTIENGEIINNGGLARTNGYGIRAFKDIPVSPDNSWVETVNGKVWYNSTLGLISVLVGTNQFVTIQDKNVGATSVWNTGDSVNETNSGKYFQWGNNYGFTYGSTGDTSSTKVDASSYGPSNIYNSSTFIVRLNEQDWSTVKNNNLRGYTDFTS